MDSADRWVQDTQFIDAAHNRVRVCTVFVGIDVSFGDQEPILFETMVFGGPCDRELYRYCTWEEAMQGHIAIIDRCKLSNEAIRNSPLLFKAQEIAQRTLKKASHVAVKSMVERSFR